ncbi:MAG: 16S rRNA (guanine(966)-N(2))-methyltransferase RsmD [Rhabdochlamydiaceae bacterium]
MTLKILGGEFSGRLLKAPKGTQTRPTTSMLRKAVFDILQPTIQDAVFLDLFSGSGAMGIEALSRGARLAIFVDCHRAAIQTLKENLSLLNLEAKSRIIQSDVFKALTKLQEMNTICDIIYADPPYDKSKLYLELLKFFDTSPLLRPQGMLFLESPTPSPLENLSLTHLKPLSSRKYGSSTLFQFLTNP